MVAQGSLFEYDAENKEWIFPETSGLVVALADRLEGQAALLLSGEVHQDDAEVQQVIDKAKAVMAAAKPFSVEKDDAYDYMPSWLETVFAEIGIQDGEGPPVVIAKIFNPQGRETWYITEWLPDTRRVFGFCVGPFTEREDEWGYSDLDEMIAIRVPPLGLPFERDLWWTPKSAEDIPEIKKVWS